MPALSELGGLVVRASALVRRAAAPVDGEPWPPPGHVLELTGDFAGAATSTAVGALVDVQRAGGIVAWLQPQHGALFPPDLAANGVDLDALVVVHLPAGGSVGGAGPDVAAGTGGAAGSPHGRSDGGSDGRSGTAARRVASSAAGGAPSPARQPPVCAETPRQTFSADLAAPATWRVARPALPPESARESPRRSPRGSARGPSSQRVDESADEPADDPANGAGNGGPRAGAGDGVGAARRAGGRGARDAGGHALPQAAELLLRSGAFDLVVLDLRPSPPPRGAWLGRLQALAREHATRVLLLTDSRAPLAFATGLAQRLAPSRRRDGDRFVVAPVLVRDKLHAGALPPARTHCGPIGLGASGARSSGAGGGWAGSRPGGLA